ncbi:MAG: aminotransferase class V-fold PLP-dependent enzyme, partial [Planctomycetota bacterium]
MQTTETHTDPIAEAVANLGDGPLTEESLAAHIHPLFSRVQQGLRERDEIYLANHSLGRPLDRMADDVRAALDAWYETMDDAWQPWEDAMHRYRGVVANLIGCADPRAVVTKTSAGQGLRAVLNAMETTRPRIVTTTGEFDSIDFILKTYAHRGRADIAWVGPDDAGLFQAERIIEAISSDTDLVVVSQICYATGQVIEHLPSIIERAHAAHALVVIDTYHSAGAMPVGFGDLGADFAIGGNYKYTRGGPGACWLAINAQHLSASSSPGMRTLDTGWFAKAGTMEFERPDQPLLGSGGDAWLESTPPVLAFVQALAGLELTTALGPARLA